MRLPRSVLILAALAVPLAPRAQVKKVRVAILEIRPLGTETSKAELLSEVALTEASSLQGFEVIGKSDINSIIGFEKQKKVMGCGDDSSCLAEIGGALGVDFILVGSVGTIGDLYRLDLKLVETRKAKVRSRIGITVEGKESKLVAAIQKGVRDLLLPETPKEQPKVAAAPPPRAEPAPKPAEPPPPAKADAKPASAAQPQPYRDPAPPGSSGGPSRRTWAYVAGGTGAALFLGGVVAGLGARSAYQKEQDASAAGDAATYEDQKAKVKSLSTTADALFVLGAAGLGVGTWLYVTSAPGGLSLQVTPAPGGALASISGGF